MDELRKAQLKAQALTEKLAQKVSEYESQFADMRVEFTALAEQNEALQSEVNSLRAAQQAQQTEVETGVEDSQGEEAEETN